jgi:hypothetical protein
MNDGVTLNPTDVTGDFHYIQYHMLLKLSHYTPRRRLWREKIYLLLILDLGTKWG